MIILNRNYFRGIYEVTFPTINGRDSVIETSLASFEREELVKLFGQDLFVIFEANPIDPIFTPLNDPLLIDGNYSEGLKEVITAFVYLSYQRASYSMSTENGRVKKDSSNASFYYPYQRDLQMYNKAVQGWRAIQSYCSTNYPEFGGIARKIQFY